MTATVISFAALVFFAPLKALAHCPLCTAGAIAAGGVAAWLGVSELTVGIFIGAASLSLGWWSAKQIKKQYVQFQTFFVSSFIFLTIILPAIPFMPSVSSIYLSWFGEYGFVYAVNSFLVGSLIGAAIALAAPWVSRLIIKARGDLAFPFQGVIVTLTALVIASALVELLA